MKSLGFGASWFNIFYEERLWLRYQKIPNRFLISLRKTIKIFMAGISYQLFSMAALPAVITFPRNRTSIFLSSLLKRESIDCSNPLRQLRSGTSGRLVPHFFSQNLTSHPLSTRFPLNFLTCKIIIRWFSVMMSYKRWFLISTT